jgi:predicted DNA-binding protein
MPTRQVPKDKDANISARIETETRDALAELARRNERSFAAEVRLAIRAYLEKENGS